MSGEIQGGLDTLSSVETKYKGKKYCIGKRRKEEQKVIPVGEVHNNVEESRKKEIIVKDYKVEKGNVTVNVNGETIIVGGGPVKHLTIWGSIVLLLVIIFCVIWRRSIKMKKAMGRRIKKGAKDVKNR